MRVKTIYGYVEAADPKPSTGKPGDLDFTSSDTDYDPYDDTGEDARSYDPVALEELRMRQAEERRVERERQARERKRHRAPIIITPKE